MKRPRRGLCYTPDPQNPYVHEHTGGSCCRAALLLPIGGLVGGVRIVGAVLLLLLVALFGVVGRIVVRIRVLHLSVRGRVRPIRIRGRAGGADPGSTVARVAWELVWGAARLAACLSGP